MEDTTIVETSYKPTLGGHLAPLYDIPVSDLIMFHRYPHYISILYPYYIQYIYITIPIIYIYTQYFKKQIDTMTTITVKQPRRLCSSRQAEQSFPLRAMGEQPRASVPPSSGCETPLLIDDCRDIYIYHPLVNVCITMENHHF